MAGQRGDAHAPTGVGGPRVTSVICAEYARKFVGGEASSLLRGLQPKVCKSITKVSTGPSAVGPVARATSAADLRHALRTAVLAELGSDPPGLDAVVDRVLKSRSR